MRVDNVNHPWNQLKLVFFLFGIFFVQFAMAMDPAVKPRDDKSWTPDRVRDDKSWTPDRVRGDKSWTPDRVRGDKSWTPDRVRGDTASSRGLTAGSSFTKVTLLL